jgi:hypothetical protein
MLSVIYVVFTNCAQYAVKLHQKNSSNVVGVLSPRRSSNPSEVMHFAQMNNQCSLVHCYTNRV